MAKIGIYNFTLQRRADHSFNVNLKDSNNANEDLTGKVIISQIWDEPRTHKIADASIVITSAANGNISWSVSDDQTSLMTENKYFYDVLKIESNGKRKYFLEGTITMSEGYTTQ